MISARETLDGIAATCGTQMPLPPAGAQRVFAEPWQAQLFAMTVALNEAGHLPWAQWAEALGARVAGGAADGSDYYEQWAAALGDILHANGTLSPRDIRRATAAWHDAASRTPHGQPITLGVDQPRARPPIRP